MPVLKNARHEKYVQNLIAGMSQRQAYRDAFSNSKKWKDATVDSKASALLNGKVLERYREIQNEQKNDALLTRWEKRKILADIARDKTLESSDRTRAIDIDNRMENEYTSKIEVGGLKTEQTKLDDILQQMRGGG